MAFLLFSRKNKVFKPIKNILGVILASKVCLWFTTAFKAKEESTKHDGLFF
jgi:hypothetical protein